MNFFTHRIITERIFDYLEINSPVSLSKFYLLLGSVRPDYIRQPISHCLDDTAEIFFQKLNDLCILNPSENKKRFSLELGKIFIFYVIIFVLLITRNF